MRVRYTKHGDPTPGALKMFRHLYPAYPRTNDVVEAFVVRDLLAHNHLWEVKYSWEEEGNSTTLLEALHTFGGDDKYKDHVVAAERRTKGLQLHVLPNRVDRRDAATILRVVWEVLAYMDADDHTACPASPGYVKFGTKMVLFRDFVLSFYDWANSENESNPDTSDSP